MVFNYGIPYTFHNLKHQSVAVPQSFLTGQATTSYRLSVLGAIGMVGIVFRPAPNGKINSIHIEWNHANFQRQLGN